MDTLPDRPKSALDIVRDIWIGIGLPPYALESVNLTGDGLGLPSSFKIGALAQSTITLSALSAALVHTVHMKSHIIPRITVPLRHAVTEFRSERYYSINDTPNQYAFSPVGGVHKTQDGYVRIHDAFPHHRDGALKLLGLENNAKKADVAGAVAKWRAIDLENKGIESGLVIGVLKSFEEWDKSTQAPYISKFPVSIRRIDTGSSSFQPAVDTKSFINRLPSQTQTKCLQGLRVLDLSRVIAGPLAGKTLAAHGADVLWVTAPHLPDLPEVDVDMGRGKRTVQLDLRTPEDRATLLALARDADVFLQSYRPGALEALGLGPADVAAVNSRIVYANLSAYGTGGPWAGRRGFDSIVQTGTGLNVAEAASFGNDAVAQKTLPCQALDHASGYLLATGINAALWKSSVEGGAWIVDVSLAGTGAYLRSLGQLPGKSGFECEDVTFTEAQEYTEAKESGFGELKAVKHSASIEGMDIGWDVMPKKLGSDKPEWL